jgi:hypothetical protein
LKQLLNPFRNKKKIIMGGIRVLVVLSYILNAFFIQGSNRVVDENPEGEIKNSMPERWRISENHLHDIDPLIDALPYMHNQKIKVKHAAIKTTMTARPTLASLFKLRKNRTYIIRINNNDSFSGVLYKDIPSEARIGLWAHEMMHIKDYDSRGFWGVLYRGWQYLSIKGKIRFEREIDQMVIDAGLGAHLYRWSYFVMEESHICPAYKAFKQKIYLSPCEINQSSGVINFNTIRQNN